MTECVPKAVESQCSSKRKLTKRQRLALKRLKQKAARQYKQLLLDDPIKYKLKPLQGSNVPASISGATGNAKLQVSCSADDSRKRVSQRVTEQKMQTDKNKVKNNAEKLSNEKLQNNLKGKRGNDDTDNAKAKKRVKSNPTKENSSKQKEKNKPKGKHDTVDTNIDVVPDRNWKELAKKLGLKSKKQESSVIEGVEKQETGQDATKISGGEVWFDDVDDILIEKPMESPNDLSSKLIKANTFTGLTKCLAMDCEMVGVGPDGNDSVLARISVVNQYGHCVYDKFVKPKEDVTDYRTWVSGVRPEDLENAEELENVQKTIHEMFKGRLLVGHAIGNDEKVLFMNHPKKFIRDTQKYPPFRKAFGGRKPGLKALAQKYLGVKIQSGEHSSVQDAQATMRLYTLVRQKWEALIKERYQKKKIISEKFKKQLEEKNKRI